MKTTKTYQTKINGQLVTISVYPASTKRHTTFPQRAKQTRQLRKF